MIRVLWVCNVPSEEACAYKHIDNTAGGWLSGLLNALKNDDSLEIHYCYPDINAKVEDSFKIGTINYHTFYASSTLGVNNDKRNLITNKQIKRIIKSVNPDIIHLHGTEYVHSLMFYENAINKDTVVCSIQGLVSIISKHYLRLIPYSIYNKVNISCIVKGTLKQQEKKLRKRGHHEIKLLQSVNNVIGRTDWDKACTYSINKNIKYYKCNEILRDDFYSGSWNASNCYKHRIFFSQASSPLKGFNILLEAIQLLRDDYPDLEIYVAGNNFIEYNSLIQRLKKSTYADYISRIMDEKQLKNVHFLGNLKANEMKQEYLKANVFVSSSSIENSSNSISEAMILGVPVISSFVGGIPSMIIDKHEGILYQADSPQMLANAIKTLFDDDTYASFIGQNARKRALMDHSPNECADMINRIYQQIVAKSKNVDKHN